MVSLPIPLPSILRRGGALACICLLLACGDDEGSDTAMVTGPVSTGDPTSTTGTTSEDGSTSGSADGSTGGTTAGSSDGGSTTGAAEDPSYPMPDGGNCSGGTAPVMLPGAEICAPFCTGRADACPAAASGDAPPVCTPFLGNGGSGDPCDEMTPCAMGEACSPEGTCGDVAFWACQLACTDGETCPDGMICSGIGTCGYP
ncbi:MAG: hypothetical protein KDK70_15440 [Myxococcales bacterium]|nr:hypothetical protein [Myxococcales bacterium]